MEEKEIYYVVKIIEIDGNTKFFMVPGNYYGVPEEIRSPPILPHFSLILIKVASAGSIYLPPELVSESIIERVRKIDEFFKSYIAPFRDLEDMKYYDVDTLRPVDRISYDDGKYKIVEYRDVDGQAIRVEKYHLIERCYEAYIRSYVRKEECDEEYILLEQSGKAVEKGSVLRSVKSAEGRKTAEEMLNDIIEEVIFSNHDIAIELTPDKRKPLIRIEWKGLWGECKEDKIDGYRYGMGPLSEWACNIMNLWSRFKQMLIKE